MALSLNEFAKKFKIGGLGTPLKIPALEDGFYTVRFQMMLEEIDQFNRDKTRLIVQTETMVLNTHDYFKIRKGDIVQFDCKHYHGDAEVVYVQPQKSVLEPHLTIYLKRVGGSPPKEYRVYEKI